MHAVDSLLLGLQPVSASPFARLNGAAHPLRTEPVNLSAVLVTCAARHARAADARGLVLTVNGAPVSGAYPHLDLAVARTYAVAVDLDGLDRIACTLIGHAVRSTEQGAVAVRVTGDPSCPGFEVADSGPGLLPASLPEGARGDLRVAGALARLIGGSITVRCRTGEGTAFRVRLPAGAGGQGLGG